MAGRRPVLLSSSSSSSPLKRETRDGAAMPPPVPAPRSPPPPPSSYVPFTLGCQSHSRAAAPPPAPSPSCVPPAPAPSSTSLSSLEALVRSLIVQVADLNRSLQDHEAAEERRRQRRKEKARQRRQRELVSSLQQQRDEGEHQEEGAALLLEEEEEAAAPNSSSGHMRRKRRRAAERAVSERKEGEGRLEEEQAARDSNRRERHSKRKKQQQHSEKEQAHELGDPLPKGTATAEEHKARGEGQGLPSSPVSLPSATSSSGPPPVAPLLPLPSPPQSPGNAAAVPPAVLAALSTAAGCTPPWLPNERPPPLLLLDSPSTAPSSFGQSHVPLQPPHVPAPLLDQAVEPSGVVVSSSQPDIDEEDELPALERVQSGPRDEAKEQRLHSAALSLPQSPSLSSSPACGRASLLQLEVSEMKAKLARVADARKRQKQRVEQESREKERLAAASELRQRHLRSPGTPSSQRPAGALEQATRFSSSSVSSAWTSSRFALPHPRPPPSTYSRPHVSSFLCSSSSSG